MDWKNSDPRDTMGRCDIVVSAPEGEVFMAHVETKHAWCVFFKRGKDRNQHIAEEDKWPPEFFWTPAPRRR